MNISRVGVDIAKSVFHVHAVDRHDQAHPSAQGRIRLSGSRMRLPASNPLRTVHASFPAHGSSLYKGAVKHPAGLP